MQIRASANWLSFFNFALAIRITQYAIRNELALFFRISSKKQDVFQFLTRIYADLCGFLHINEGFCGFLCIYVSF